uniref:Cytochrome c oxidase subunit 2 n=1 Tax=Vischeria sp. CAUP Q 202 TaxID=1805947 RepID=A0A140F2S9_9STRA|nr:cytochrome c oxidase subunit 2 [Vischeria punctata]AML60713.1 cytochrome c oxidase subunit 2 [Vischeria sp. CAUP Q 202]UUA03915.1 cytochrome c oxidase subunit 2 [Vischeria punctata]
MKIIFLLGIVFYNISNISLADAAKAWQIGFQDPATPVMEGIIDFHNHLMIFIVPIMIFVMWLLYKSLKYYAQNNTAPSSIFYDQYFSHSTLLEVVWTILPAFVLMAIAVPSFALLYSMEESVQPSLTLKVVGHQWYWSYEYPEIHVFDEVNSSNFKLTEPYFSEIFYPTTMKKFYFATKYPDNLAYNGALANSLNFDSYMIAEEDLTKGSLRLLEVDRRVVLPEKTHIRILVSAADVLHSWAIPSFGLKIDACPGRLNQSSLFIKRAGLYFGQCSEICGVNHGFMPIVVKVVDRYDFQAWIESKIGIDS